jgi:hypothetical protein
MNAITVPATSTTESKPRATASNLMLAGAALVGVGALLPWEEDTGPFGVEVTKNLPGGGVALVVGLAAFVAWTGWTLRSSRVSKSQHVGVVIVAAVLGMLALAKFGALAGAQHKVDAANNNGPMGGFLAEHDLSLHYGAGSGLYLHFVGVVAMSIGIVRVWFSRRRLPRTNNR